MTARPPCSVNHLGHHAGAHATRVNHNGVHATHEAHATRSHQGISCPVRPSVVLCALQLSCAPLSCPVRPSIVLCAHQLSCTCHAHARPTEWWSTGGGRPVRRVEEWGTRASRTLERSKAGCGRPEGGGGEWAAKTVKRPPQQPAQPQYANYRALLTHKRRPPQPAQPQHTNHWAPRTWRQHQLEHQAQQPTQRSNLMQHAKGRTGDCPGPCKGTATRRNVTQGEGGWTLLPTPRGHSRP